MEPEEPLSKTRTQSDPGMVDSFMRSGSTSVEAMREVGGSEEEGQIMGELGGRGLEPRTAEAEMSMVQLITSSGTLESWIYASFTAISVHSDKFLVKGARSAQVEEEDRFTSVSPAPEFGKAGSEPADPDTYKEAGSSSDLTITSGGIPTSSS